MIKQSLGWYILVALSFLCVTAQADTPAETALERYEDIRAQIGAVCVADVHCEAPLRCMSGTCGEPPAMSGVTEESTSFVRFHGENGVSLFYLEVVDQQAQRQRGLMFRPWLLENWGMLFIFPDARPRSFWMRNTYIPLDMVFVGADGTVVGVVENAEPLTEVSRAVDGSSRYVIELNAGEAQIRGLTAGVRCDILNLPDRD